MRLLGAVRTERLAILASDGRFTARIADAAANLRAYLTEPKWYQTLTDAPQTVAYFSPEYGITAVLPQYSGGLGILAGDHLKAASDLGVPIVGVGLLYKHGYFRQSLSRDAWQLETYPLIDPDNMPLTKLREADGTAVRVTIGLPGLRELVAQVWLAQVGRVPLLLLDTDIEDNADGGREITDRLYGGSSEHRLHQEMLLGIGGIRAVRAYCADHRPAGPEVFHTNEGHAGFLGVERIRELIEEHGLDFGDRARRGPLRHPVHHAHPGPSRHRPVLARPDRRALRRRQPGRRRAASRMSSRSARRTTPAATPARSTWP